MAFYDDFDDYDDMGDWAPCLPTDNFDPTDYGTCRDCPPPLPMSKEAKAAVAFVAKYATEARAAGQYVEDYAAAKANEAIAAADAIAAAADANAANEAYAAKYAEKDAIAVADESGRKKRKVSEKVDQRADLKSAH